MTAHVEPASAQTPREWVRRPAIFLPLFAPFGISSGHVTVTLAFLLDRAVLSMLAITTIIAATLWVRPSGSIHVDPCFASATFCAPTLLDWTTMLHDDGSIAMAPGPGFVPAPLPSNEAARLGALHRFKLLDTEDEQAYDDLATLASVICGTPIGLISLIDSDRQWFKSKVGLEATETSREQSFCAHAILRPDELFEVDNALADARFRANPLVQGEPHIRFYAGAPLVTSEGLAIGTVCAIDKRPRALSDEQRGGLRSLARLVVAQFEMRRVILDLEHQSTTDALTGVGNRLAFDRTLLVEWNRHVRNHKSLGLLMIDVDSFKSFNDRFGHPAGDEALIQVSASMRASVRSSDSVSRYGGEEFSVILPETGFGGAMIQAERIRAAIERAHWPLRPVTASIGVWASVPSRETDRNILVAKADRALYMAKQGGRNRVNGFDAWI